MVKFKDWFGIQLKIAKYPFPAEYDEGNEFHNMETIINVSDEIHFDHMLDLKKRGFDYHWFPMNERRKDIGLNQIYACMFILYECEKRNRTVLLHCHGGANRSIIIRNAYYYIRTGQQQDGKENQDNRLVMACRRGYLPPLAEMESFLANLRNHLLLEDGSGCLDKIKISSINNF